QRDGPLRLRERQVAVALARPGRIAAEDRPAGRCRRFGLRRWLSAQVGAGRKNRCQGHKDRGTTRWGHGVTLRVRGAGAGGRGSRGELRVPALSTVGGRFARGKGWTSPVLSGRPRTVTRR